MPLLPSSEIKHRFQHHPPSPEKIEQHKSVREICEDLAHHINEFIPPGREQATALTKVEEVMFWANAGIARS